MTTVEHPEHGEHTPKLWKTEPLKVYHDVDLHDMARFELATYDADGFINETIASVYGANDSEEQLGKALTIVRAVNRDPLFEELVEELENCESLLGALYGTYIKRAPSGIKQDVRRSWKSVRTVLAKVEEAGNV